MELIAFPRTGLDGQPYSQDEIEKAFINGVVEEISDRLDNVITTSCKEEKCIKISKTI